MESSNDFTPAGRSCLSLRQHDEINKLIAQSRGVVETVMEANRGDDKQHTRNTAWAVLELLDRAFLILSNPECSPAGAPEVQVKS